jgi:hypothetical protein
MLKMQSNVLERTPFTKRIHDLSIQQRTGMLLKHFLAGSFIVKNIYINTENCFVNDVYFFLVAYITKYVMSVPLGK